MDKEKFSKYLKDYIHLIGAYLNKKTIDFTIDDNNLPFFVNLSKRHSLTALLYKAIKETGTKIDETHLKKLEEYYLANVRKCVLFEEERKALYAFLKENHIEYTELKGLVLKDFYYDPYTREFADNDILFDGKNDMKVRSFFTHRGYSVEQFRRSNHDIYLKKPFFNFEMHRDLFFDNEDNDKFIKFFETNRILYGAHGCKYDVAGKPENFYVYFTAHTYKHFNSAGCGLRTLVDYYIFLKRIPYLDKSLINRQLKEIDLVDFSKKFSSLAIKVFDEKALSEEEMDMLLFIASSGTYGTVENRVSKGVKEKGRFGYFMSRAFPPYRYYKTTYSWAYKCPILIPIAWICRTFRVIFKRNKLARDEIKIISKTKKEDK